MGYINPKAIQELIKTGKKDLAKQVLMLFVNQTPAEINNIITTYKSGNAESIRKAAHKYKSSARAIGADALMQLCYEVEKMSLEKKHQSPEVSKRIGQIQKLAPLVVKEAQVLIPKL